MKLAVRLFITILLLSSIGLLSTVASSATGTVQIDQPAANDVVAGLIQIRGTALLTSSSPGEFRYYRLEYTRVDDANRSFTAAGETVEDAQVSGGLLDTWDTTQVQNGTYIIRLQVFGANGAVKETSVPVIVSNDLPPLEPEGEQVAFAPAGGESLTPLQQNTVARSVPWRDEDKTGHSGAE